MTRADAVASCAAWPRWVRLSVTFGVVLVLLTVVTVPAMLGRFARLVDTIDTVDLDRGAGTASAGAVRGGGTNLLLVGSDARDGDPALGDRADSMVLVHLSEDRSRIDAVQIPRDTMMDLPACTDDLSDVFAGQHGMLNAALGDGAGCLVKAVEALSGARVDHFLELRFAGFARIVDALDGVPVDLPEAMVDPKADLDLPAGEQVLDGAQALAWARTRYGIGDGSDIGRMGNQQTVMYTVVDRIKERRLATRPKRAYTFLEAVTSSVRADPDLADVRTLARLGAGIARVPRESISIDLMPWEPDPDDPNRVVPAAEAEGIFAALAGDEPLGAAPRTTVAEPGHGL
ncbi:LCP family protein [Kocuria sp. U4B]|nr:LCP family protein [Kocuria rosea]